MIGPSCIAVSRIKIKFESTDRSIVSIGGATSALAIPTRQSRVAERHGGRSLHGPGLCPAPGPFKMGRMSPIFARLSPMTAIPKSLLRILLVAYLALLGTASAPAAGDWPVKRGP